MECVFKFIQQWRSKLLFHIEQQLNISKTLRSAFPNHGTMTSVFLYQESAFMNQPVLFLFLQIRVFVFFTNCFRHKTSACCPCNVCRIFHFLFKMILL